MSVLSVASVRNCNARSRSHDSVAANNVGAQDAAALVRAEHDEMFRRIPLGADKKLNRAAEHCPHSGLNRNQVYDLLKLRENGRYVIERALLEKKGKSRGVVMYNVGSVLRYLKRLAKEQAVEAAKA